jgi:hypothetical protein
MLAHTIFMLRQIKWIVACSWSARERYTYDNNDGPHASRVLDDIT